VTKFRQNRLTLKGRSTGQRHTDRQTDKLGLGPFGFAIGPIVIKYSFHKRDRYCLLMIFTFHELCSCIFPFYLVFFAISWQKQSLVYTVSKNDTRLLVMTWANIDEFPKKNFDWYVPREFVCVLVVEIFTSPQLHCCAILWNWKFRIIIKLLLQLSKSVLHETKHSDAFYKKYKVMIYLIFVQYMKYRMQ